MASSTVETVKVVEYDKNEFWFAIYYAKTVKSFISSARGFLLEDLRDRGRVDAVITRAEIYQNSRRLKKILMKFEKEAEEIPISKHFFDEYEKLIKEVFVPGRF